MPTLIQARFPIDYADGPPAYLGSGAAETLFRSEFLDTLAKSNQRRFSALPALPGMRPQFQTAMSNIAKVAAAGIPIVAGGDTGVPGRFHGLSIHLEMELLVKGGSRLSRRSARLLSTSRACSRSTAGMAACMKARPRISSSSMAIHWKT